MVPAAIEMELVPFTPGLLPPRAVALLRMSVPLRDDGLAGVGVVAGESESSVTGLGETGARASDRGRNGVHGGATGTDVDGGGGRKIDRAAGEGDVAGGC